MMINFSTAQEQCIGNLYDYISPEEIYFKALGYYPNDKQFFRSPFSRDTTPSFKFKYYNELIFKCFSTGKGGNAIQLVALLQGINYKDAVNYIFNNFPLSNNFPKRCLPTKKTETKIEVVLPLKIPDSFFDYWSKFEITKETLDTFNVKPAEQVWLSNDNYKDLLIANYKDKSPVIRYLVNGKYKIYSPYKPKNKGKWISNTHECDIQGLKQLPISGDLLIISKAMKDVLIWKELGFNAIALCSETCILREEVYKHFKGRFNNIVSFLDNDAAGIQAMSKYKDQFNIPYTMIPEKYKCKDLGELTETYDLETTRQLSLELLQQLKI